MTYYNRERIYTANPGGFAPAMYRQAARGLAAYPVDFGCLGSALFLTSPNNPKFKTTDKFLR